MKKIDLNLKFDGNITYLESFQAIFSRPDGSTYESLVYGSKELALKDVDFQERNFDYRFLYFRRELIFL